MQLVAIAQIDVGIMVALIRAADLFLALGLNLSKIFYFRFDWRYRTEFFLNPQITFNLDSSTWISHFSNSLADGQLSIF